MYNHKGCEKFINYNDYSSHLYSCKFRLYHCNNKPCKKEGFLDELKEHSKKCNYRIYFCYLCNEKLIYKNFQAHLDKDCPQADLTCIFCDAIMKRVDYLKSHKTEDANCLKMIIKEKNKKLNEYDNLFGKMKTKLKEQRKIIEDNENIMKRQQNEITKLKNLSTILKEKNEEKIKIFNEIRQYFTEPIGNDDEQQQTLNINKEIQKKNNENIYMNTGNNFYSTKNINGRNQNRNSYGCLTDKRNYRK